MQLRCWLSVTLALTLCPAMGCMSLSHLGIPSLEDSLVFHPRTLSPDVQPGNGVQECWFESPDGVRLHGWYAEAERPQAIILYTHGNAGNIGSRHGLLRYYRDKFNASILVFDYRGYGRSEGKPSESGILADARAARRWLATKAGVAESDIVLIGHSMGGGVAVDLAAQDGARGLVLESTFTSLPDVAAGLLPLAPVHWMMHNRLDSESKIGNYHGPLLQVHGDADWVVPYKLGCRLFAAANEPKRFVTLPGGGHNDPPTKEYQAALREFFASLPPCR